MYCSTEDFALIVYTTSILSRAHIAVERPPSYGPRRNYDPVYIIYFLVVVGSMCLGGRDPTYMSSRLIFRPKPYSETAMNVD